jgi:hypothetical protein
MKTPIALAGILLGTMVGPGIANASLVLDTGTPPNSTMPMVLDGNDYYAAEFSLASTSVINSVSAYLLAGLDSPGDTFTISIYSDPITSRNASADYSVQGTYLADGWNTTSTAGLGFQEGPGNYWVALEVGANDNAIGLNLPVGQVGGGTAPALGFAYNSGSGYSTAGAMPFGVQVDASPVPLPPAIWLLGSGILGIGFAARRRHVPM